MPLKEQKGNMYEFVTHMWSPIRGKCVHDCSYCYMKIWGEPKPLHIDRQDLKKTNLGEGNFIFVVHTADLFAEDVPDEWINAVLDKLRQFPKNRYLLQSKNPARMKKFTDKFPKDVLLGTTIETNRDSAYVSKAPTMWERAEALGDLFDEGFETMVTIEPILDFDLEELVNMIIDASPTWVNIGADSKKHNLPEPPQEKVKELIETLQEKTDVELKRNLQRILKTWR